MPRTKHRRHIVLAFPVSVPHMAIAFRGVADYARQRGGWDFITSPPTLGGTGELALTAHAIEGLSADGVIVAINDRAEARVFDRLRLPAVNISSLLRTSKIPRVTVDNRLIGRLGAEHLLTRGLRHLAYVGFRGLWYSEERQRGFLECAREAGADCDVFEELPNRDVRAPWHERTAALGRWLKTLRLPVGILAVHDYRARVIVDQCARLGRNVPQDVAVLGVDNDTIVCEYCQPTLSSISRNAWRVGYEAAAILDRLMAGRSGPKAEVRIPPDGVVARRSTDIIAVDDPHVSAAVHFFHEHLSEPLSIGQVIEHVSISRRRLERQFRRLLHCTPHEYLCRVRVEKAKQLLASSDALKIRKIADECGFATALRMRLTFRRLEGVTPQQYRQSLRLATKAS